MIESGDYISREETLKRLCKDVCNVSDCQCDESRCPEWYVIHDFPAADVRPVVKAQWVPNVPHRDLRPRCTACGMLHPVRTNFCPNCGARMLPEPPKEE